MYYFIPNQLFRFQQWITVNNFSTKMVTAKVWKKANEFKGEPKLSDFQIVEEELPALQDGQILIEAEYLSVDPYMRVFDVAPDSVMIGGQIGKWVWVCKTIIDRL